MMAILYAILGFAVAIGVVCVIALATKNQQLKYVLWDVYMLLLVLGLATAFVWAAFAFGSTVGPVAALLVAALVVGLRVWKLVRSIRFLRDDTRRASAP